MKSKNYTPERRIVCVGSAMVGSASLETRASLRRSMNDAQATADSWLVLDTGARCTTLNERLVAPLRLQPTGRTVTLQMADGRTVECQTYQIYIQFTFGPYYGPYEVPALTGMHCDMVIGLDIITQGELHVNRISNTEVEFIFIMHIKP